MSHLNPDQFGQFITPKTDYDHDRGGGYPVGVGDGITGYGEYHDKEEAEHGYDHSVKFSLFTDVPYSSWARSAN